MDSGYVYREPGENLSQGDIIRNLVHLIYKPPPIVLRRRDTKRGSSYEPFTYDTSLPLDQQQNSPRGGFKLSEGTEVVAFGNLGMAMVLSHGCDIDKPNCKHWVVAPVRDLAQLPGQDQETIRAGDHKRFFHLPAYRDVLRESYVDMRRLTSVAAQPAGDFDRMVSLTDEALEDLHWHLFRFITRREIVGDIDDVAPVGEE